MSGKSLKKIRAWRRGTLVMIIFANLTQVRITLYESLNEGLSMLG